MLLLFLRFEGLCCVCKNQSFFGDTTGAASTASAEAEGRFFDAVSPTRKIDSGMEPIQEKLRIEQKGGKAIPVNRDTPTASTVKRSGKR